MPIFEGRCQNPECRGSQYPQEHFYWHADAELAGCDVCGGPTAKLISVVHAIWLKTLGEYNDPKKERAYSTREGHLMYRKHSTRNPDGSPEPVMIRTRKDQIEYCKAEHYAMPDEIGNVEVSSDGKKLQSAGIAGQWI